MRVRWGVVVFTFLMIPGLFLGLTAAFYAVACGAEWLLTDADLPLLGKLHFPGGGALANIVTLMLITVMVFATVLTLAERKWSAMMQDRVGPNRANIGGFTTAGVPHMAADAIKMLTKEDFIPATASKFLFGLAPILAFVPVFCLFAVVPVAPPITWLFGQTVALQVASPDFGLLYIFAIASLAVYGTALAGWSSNNKFALLGGIRASSQMISYEVALGLSLVGAMMTYSTLKLENMVTAPDALSFAQNSVLWGDASFGLPAWGIVMQPLGFVLFFAAAFAETKRAPFDMPEGESEIIGYFVEYSGMRFGMFMIAEFMEIVVLSGVTASVFFGGYHLPFGEPLVASMIGVVGLAFVQGMTFWLKVLVLCWLQLAIRWTLPRFRYDQVQTLGWRMLLPVGLVNVFVTGALLLWDPSMRLLAIVGLLELATLVGMVLWKRSPADESRGAPSQGHPADAHGHAHAAPAAAAH